MYGLRIVIADADINFRKTLKDMLAKLDCIVIAEAVDGRSALQIIMNTQPDLVILDPKLPGRKGLEVAKTIVEHRVAPVLLLSDFTQEEILDYAKNYWIFSYLLKPVEEVNLIVAIELTIANFHKLLDLEMENKKLKDALKNRILLDKAKGILMENKGFTEKEAYRFLQRKSMDKCIPIEEVAQEIIEANY